MVDPEGRTVGATYLRNNLDKRSVGIDLKAPEGRELFLALVPHFDVVAENFKAGTMDRMGLGYDAIAARAPARDLRVDLGLRQHRSRRRTATGPRTRRSSRRCRASTTTRQPDEPPVTIPVGALGDISSALFGVIGVLAALRHRDRTGEGQYVDIAMFDAMVAMTDIVTNFWSLGVRPEPDKALEVICEGFRASDGYVVDADRARAPVRRRWPSCVGHPEWNDDPRFATARGLGAAPRDGDPPRGRGVGVDSARSSRPRAELTAAGIAAGPSNHAPRT